MVYVALVEWFGIVCFCDFVGGLFILFALRIVVYDLLICYLPGWEPVVCLCLICRLLGCVLLILFGVWFTWVLVIYFN